ncbi:Hypothetical protein CINCED_3A020888 [Cinara cedri]|uniref:Uncharacterized protein n=1 Tax=Cinara cedri TaxID=506608 RepID=A0A5E4MUB9_9HEMI|nr:Hypothetical protein CINCED_3A020888 [Cinara cedri]
MRSIRQTVYGTANCIDNNSTRAFETSHRHKWNPPIGSFITINHKCIIPITRISVLIDFHGWTGIKRYGSYNVPSLNPKTWSTEGLNEAGKKAHNLTYDRRF